MSQRKLLVAAALALAVLLSGSLWLHAAPMQDPALAFPFAATWGRWASRSTKA